MKTLREALAVALAAAAGLALVAVTAVLATPASASAGYRAPAQQACAYFRAWQHGHSPWNLDAMMAGSVYATWNPVGTDATVLYMDARMRENTADDVADMTRACKGR